LLLIGIQLGLLGKPANPQTPVPPTETSAKSICPRQLPASIDTVLDRPLMRRSRWGVLVQPLSSNQILYSRDAQKYFTPASVTKLLTTAAVLQQLGSDFRFRTSIYSDRNGVLRVVGRGDPSLTDTQLVSLTRQLKEKGIRDIKLLIADDNYIQGDIVHPSWQWEDIQADYGAPINGLILNQNVFGLKLQPQTVGKPLNVLWNNPDEERQWRLVNRSVTTAENQPSFVNITRDFKGSTLQIQGQLPVNAEPTLVNLPALDPTEHFLRRLRSLLKTEEISVTQVFVSPFSMKYGEELAGIDSPPLSELLIETNTNSNNLFAESLLRALAIKKPPSPNQATADAGLELMKTSLTQLGVDPTGYSIVDGSGLSRKNSVSPETLVQVLQAMAKSPSAPVYRASLPVAGRSGTLKNRFLKTPAEGIVQAKTGTMTGVVSLAGYVNAPNYDALVFSIMVNQSGQPASVVRQAMDEIVVMLAQLQRC
jgi:serine-type D-Ala-D-Ala carboxypeptidase/endopeptidase (penicillin-binding protein 4)